MLKYLNKQSTCSVISKGVNLFCSDFSFRLSFPSEIRRYHIRRFTLICGLVNILILAYWREIIHDQWPMRLCKLTAVVQIHNRLKAICLRF